MNDGALETLRDPETRDRLGVLGITRGRRLTRRRAEITAFRGTQVWSTPPWSRVEGNLQSISHRCYLFEVAFVLELTKGTIHLPLTCLQGGKADETRGERGR